MKIALVYKAFEFFTFEIYSSMLKKRGHDVKLFFFPSLFDDFSIQNNKLARIFSEEKEILEDIKEYYPDIMLFSINTDSLLWTNRIAKKLRSELKNCKFIAGGPHPTIIEKNFLKKYPFYDLSVVGMGDIAIVDIVDDIPYENITGLVYRKDGEVYQNDWKALPEDEFLNTLPDKGLFMKKMPYLRKYHTTFLAFGCNYRCSFCIHSTLKRKKNYTIKKRNLSTLIKELITAKRRGSKYIIFYDDDILADKVLSMTFLNIYKKKIKLPFICISHPLSLDKESVKALKDAGCIGVEIGTQIIDEDIRKNILNRYENDISIENALKNLYEVDIPATVDHIIGIPEETFESHIKSLIFYKRSKVKRVLVSFLTAYPGITINRILLKKEHISTESLKKIENGHVENYQFHGSLKLNSKLLNLESLFEWMPFLSERKLNLLIGLLRKDIFVIPKTISKYIPFMIAGILYRHELNLKIFMKKYAYFLGKSVSCTLRVLGTGIKMSGEEVNGFKKQKVENRK